MSRQEGGSTALGCSAGSGAWQQCPGDETPSVPLEQIAAHKGAQPLTGHTGPCAHSHAPMQTQTRGSRVTLAPVHTHVYTYAHTNIHRQQGARVGWDY